MITEHRRATGMMDGMPPAVKPTPVELGALLDGMQSAEKGRGKT
jgi:hypothetical protein